MVLSFITCKIIKRFTFYVFVTHKQSCYFSRYFTNDHYVLNTTGDYPNTQN